MWQTEEDYVIFVSLQKIYFIDRYKNYKIESVCFLPKNKTKHFSYPGHSSLLFCLEKHKLNKASAVLNNILTPSKKNMSQTLRTLGQGNEREYILMNHSVQYRTGSRPLWTSLGLVGGSLDCSRKDLVNILW